MDQFNIIFFGLYLTVFATPVFAVVKRRTIEQHGKRLFLIAFISVATVSICMWLRVSFLGVVADVVILCLIYFMVGLCVFQCVGHSNLVLKIAGILSSIPFFVIPILSIPVVIEVAFIVADLEPRYSVRNENGDLCRVTSYGNATTSNGGYNAKLYRLFGFVEYKMNVAVVDNTRKPEVTPETVCKAVLSELKS